MMIPFRYDSGQFLAEEASVRAIAERFGTPLYLYSQAAILGNFKRLHQGLRDIPALLCYSVKANSNVRILRLLREAGAGFDIVSGGELARVLKAGADPHQVVFSGVGKTVAEIDAALAAGILMFNVESSGELDLIQGRTAALAGAGNKRRAGISIRINPDVEAETHPYISTGQSIHKFGVPKQDSLPLYRRATACPHLEVRGIACHIGSQILAVDPFLKALDEVLEVAQQLRSEGMAITYLDLGGGFGIPYRMERPLDLDRLTCEIEQRLEGTPYRLILEPGRTIVGNAGILLTRVLYVKRNAVKNFIVTDAGMNDLLRPALYGSHHEILPVEPRPKKVKILADVVGPLCETGDFLGRDREIDDVEPGDLLAVLTTGAYGYVLASNYNSRPRPAEVLVHGSEVELIRRRETVERLMADEVL